MEKNKTEYGKISFISATKQKIKNTFCLTILTFFSRTKSEFHDITYKLDKNSQI